MISRNQPAQLRLAAGFPAATRQAWQQLVLDVLHKSGVAGKQATPAQAEEILATETYDGVRIWPLYTAADVPGQPVGVPGLAPFVRGSRAQGPGTDGWDVRALHAHPDAKVTNSAVLTDLENGVTSLWLRLGEGGLGVPELADALHDVYLHLAPVVLDPGAQTAAAAEAYFELAAERRVPASDLAGSLGADPLGLAARTGAPADLDLAAALAVRCARGFRSLRAVVVDAQPYHDAGGSDAEELGASIATGVAYLRVLTAAGLSLAEAFGQLEFRYAATADPFATIAKLRAARRLWARVGEVCGAPPARAQRQHAVTSSVMMTCRDPWVNMLRTSLACFAAGIGGAEAVTVQPFDLKLGLPDDFSRRIARNTPIILQEESSLIQVIDPAGGSWYVESLTAELAAAGWAFFTEIERAGGMAAALSSGLVDARIAVTREKRADAIAHRHDPLTGVSEFPNPNEKLPERPPAPARSSGTAGGGLPIFDYDRDFEQLRDRADRHLAATGSRPVVFLATLGSPVSFTPRATFATNLFQAGGCETPAAGPGTDPAAVAAAFTASGARVACLCAHDKVYADAAAPVAAALKAAGARTVWLAGKPGGRAASDAEAGVDGYVFTGCNAVDVLRRTLTETGVA
ncbi:Methylmalonyl-CoA mutase small subunit [Candidatus Protofrankia californiensis]|uniref:Methylmalonyl-CoA mutase small subunit n=1 Tax=Candidatus Protofrankia californiensis TaxID=1839754 RepID=A0A1C3NUF0_9ACTN|nr:Methylmalonyl-CoA mutase small subunit [Candidatus Protofrankia californiensis]